MFRSRWTIIAFLLGFPAILLVVVYRYLLPAAYNARDLDSIGRKQLAAVSVLVLVVVLVALLVALILIVRPGRFFLPRKAEPRTRTNYPDAWHEAAQRLPTPPPDDDEDDPHPSNN